MKTLTFYFALRSPYSALASDLVHDAASSPAYADSVRFRVAPFSNLSPDFLDPTSNPLKMKYMMHDLPRLYAARGLALALPDPFNIDFSVPARVTLAAQRDGCGVAYLRTISLMRWSEGRNVSETQTLVEAAERVAWSPAAAEAALVDQTLHQAYDAALAATEAAGVFGVPFFIVEGDGVQEPFWGQDRWPMVEAALNDE